MKMWLYYITFLEIPFRLKKPLQVTTFFQKQKVMVYTRETRHGRLSVGVGRYWRIWAGMVRVWGTNLFSRPFSHFKNIKNCLWRAFFKRTHWIKNHWPIIFNAMCPESGSGGKKAIKKMSNRPKTSKPCLVRLLDVRLTISFFPAFSSD